MKNFGKFIGRIILIIILFLFFFGQFQNYIFRNGNFNKVQWINKKNKLNHDLIFIGNSRSALFGIKSDSLKYINLSDDGSGLKTTYLQLYLYFRNKNKTSQVLWDVDVYTLNNRFSDNKRSPRWLPFFNDDEIYNTLKNDYLAFKFYKILPALSYSAFKYDWNLATLFNNLFKLKKTVWGEYGFKNTCKKFEKRDDVPLGISNYDSLKPNWYWIDKIHKLCLINNAKLTMFSSPYHTVIDNYNENPIFKSELSKRKIEFYDHSRIFLKKDKYFVDYRHLNCHGVWINM